MFRNMNNEKVITPSCLFDCEMVLGPDASLESKEIREIRDESIAIRVNGVTRWVSVSDFVNEKGQTIGEFMLKEHEEFTQALMETDE